MTTQITTLLFVLLTIMSANCLRVSNGKNFIKTFLTETYTSITPTQANVAVLGKAADYAVLAGSRTTNEGSTTVVGTLGVSPGTAIAGTAVTMVDGEFHAGDAHSLAAQNDLTTAYNNLANTPRAVNKTGTDLMGLTLTPGTYKYNVACFLSAGILTLDAQNDPNAKWIFQIGTTLITAVNSSVRVINGGSALNVYWQVGSAATFNTSTVMVGNVIAYSAISFGTGATLHGRALARVGEVNMLSNVIEVKA